MIDLGLSKLALIGVVALVVIGPEKLPKVARTAGSLLGRAQRYINDVKAEVSREMELDELRKMHQEVKEAARDAKQTIEKDLAEAERDLNIALRDREEGDADSDYSYQGSSEQIASKAKNFRKKKLLRTSAIPSWYKHQHGRKSRVLSGAARVAKYKPVKTRSNSPFFH